MTAGLETFAKVRALHDRATTPGEKAAAAGRMKALAKSAGMTVKQAVSKLDAPTPKPSSFFEDLFNTPEFRARNAERERRDAARREDALAEHGSEDAVFADTEREAALRLACAPLLVWDTRPDWEGCYDLGGWSPHGGPESMPAAVRKAVADGWPMPETVAAAWAEHQAAEAVEDARYAFASGYEPHRWVEARGYVLEDILDTHPARSLNDLRARISWLEWLSRRQSAWTHDSDLIRLATLRADIERMGARLKEEAAPVQNGHDKGEAPCAHPSEAEGHATEPGKSAQCEGVQNGQGEAQSAGLGENLSGSQVSRSPISEISKGTHSVSPPAGGEAPSVQNGHPIRGAVSAPPRRTNADKRRDVLALLNAENTGITPLTDREIARRAGVAPQTVGNIRRTIA